MSGFEDVTLGWQGDEYTVPADRQMMLIAKIEAALCPDGKVQPVLMLLKPENLPYNRLAAAYGAALRFAGAKVSDEQVYLSIVQDLAEARGDASLKINSAVLGLLAIVAPPVAAKFRTTSDNDEGEPGNG